MGAYTVPVSVVVTAGLAHVTCFKQRLVHVFGGPHTPGMSVACARWLAQQPILGVGVETVGTDAGAAHSFDPPFPCHSFLLGAGKYGLTQLANLARLPTTGSVLIAAPLPIVRGSGSPARVLALVQR